MWSISCTWRMWSLYAYLHFLCRLCSFSHYSNQLLSFYSDLQKVTFSNYLNPTDCYSELQVNGLGLLIERLTTGVPFNVLNSLLPLLNHVARAVYCFPCDKRSIEDCNGWLCCLMLYKVGAYHPFALPLTKSHKWCLDFLSSFVCFFSFL